MDLTCFWRIRPWQGCHEPSEAWINAEWQLGRQSRFEATLPALPFDKVSCCMSNLSSASSSNTVSPLQT